MAKSLSVLPDMAILFIPSMPVIIDFFMSSEPIMPFCIWLWGMAAGVDEDCACAAAAKQNVTSGIRQIDPSEVSVLWFIKFFGSSVRKPSFCDFTIPVCAPPHVNADKSNNIGQYSRDEIGVDREACN